MLDAADGSLVTRCASDWRRGHSPCGERPDYAANYTFDLVGNRLQKSTDLGLDGSTDEVVSYAYDSNDRLLSEELAVQGALTATTDYAWDAAEQVGKTARNASGAVTVQTESLGTRSASSWRRGHSPYGERPAYDLQGRLAGVTITTYDGAGAATTQSLVTRCASDWRRGHSPCGERPTYDADGIKVRQTETVDEGADGTVESETATDYLNDRLNHTGYVQVLEEKATDDGGATTRTTTYTIGHDVIAQFSAALGALVLLADGHGSTRAVAGMTGQVQQEYLYDAYGHLLNLEAGSALTNLLYSGEQFNASAGLQYLRARWYDPTTGRFSQLDPFAGNTRDPLSLHKYAYCHANPIMGTDPSGWGSTFSLGEQVLVVAVQAALFAMAGGTISFIYQKARGASNSIALNNALRAAMFSAGFAVPGLRWVLMGVGAYSFGSRALAGDLDAVDVAELITYVVVFRMIETGVMPVVKARIGAQGSGRVVVPYRNSTDVIERAYGGQAHHLNEQAAFRDCIPYRDGLVTNTRGDALTDAGSPHAGYHSAMNTWWGQFRQGGARSFEKPTIGEYAQATQNAFREAGLPPHVVSQLAEMARMERLSYGLKDSMAVPRVPNPGNYAYPTFPFIPYVPYVQAPNTQDGS